MTSDNSQQNWPKLMLQAQQGDAVAYRQLLGEIAPPLRRFLKTRLFTADHAEDVLQEILLAIHTARHTFRPDQPFANWMYGIAKHKMIDYMRKQIRLNNNEINDDELVTFIADPANNPEERLSDKDLRAALGQLPDKQRQVLVLTKIEGYSMAETGKRLQMSETAVKVTAHRAYKKLKRILVEHGYE